jgi:hypothetical protein
MSLTANAQKHDVKLLLFLTFPAATIILQKFRIMAKVAVICQRCLFILTEKTNHNAMELLRF